MPKKRSEIFAGVAEVPAVGVDGAGEAVYGDLHAGEAAHRQLVRGGQEGRVSAPASAPAEIVW